MKFRARSIKCVACHCLVSTKCYPNPQPPSLFFWLRDFFLFINFVHHCHGQALP